MHHWTLFRELLLFCTQGSISKNSIWKTYEKSNYAWVKNFIAKHRQWDSSMITQRAIELSKVYYSQILKRELPSVPGDWRQRLASVLQMPALLLSMFATFPTMIWLRPSLSRSRQDLCAKIVCRHWLSKVSQQWRRRPWCSGRAEIATAGRENKPNVAGNKKPLPQFLQTLYTGKCQQPSGKDRNERDKW